MTAWTQNPDLMARLIAAQNHPVNADRDVVTFAGFFDTREELEAHVWACEDAVERADGYGWLQGEVAA